MIQIDVDFLPYKRIAEEAHVFLVEQGHHETLPVPVEEIIEFNLNLDIVPIPNLQRDFDIEGFTSSDITAIYVDEFVYLNRYPRYRFTLAHELGHIVLHPHIFAQYRFDSVASWKKFVNEADPKAYSMLEFQGYSFGGLLLVPPQHLERLFHENLDKVTPLIEQAQARGLDRGQYLDYAKDRMASILAPSFEVSTDVLLRRIELAGLEKQVP